MNAKWIVLITLAALLAGCGRQEGADDGRPVIGVSLLNLSSEFIVMIDRAMSAGIPIVNVNSETKAVPTAFVGSRDEESGRLAMWSPGTMWTISLSNFRR